MKGRSCGLFLCLFLGIACFSGYQVLRILHEYRVGADAYFKLEQFASLPPASEETEETPAELAWPEVDFTALAAVNPDVTAWLYGPDTGISYPVVQGTDNDYYLDHLLDGTANSAGCLFVDTSCRPDFSGRNTVIYGHRMKNGTMFAALGNYQEQVYYDAHPVFLLVTPEGRYVVELFSGYVADTAESAWMLDFSNEQAMELALVENLQREDLDPVEEAVGIRELMTRCDLTQEQAARKLGKSRSALANSLRLLSLPETVLELLKSGFITIGHAKVVLGLPTPELQEEAAQMIADNQLNVRQAEALCKKLAKPAKEPVAAPLPSALPVEVEESLKQALGSEVRVAYHDGKGKLTVHFYSDDQLKAFANLLGQYSVE